MRIHLRLAMHACYHHPSRASVYVHSYAYVSMLEVPVRACARAQLVSACVSASALTDDDDKRRRKRRDDRAGFAVRWQLSCNSGVDWFVVVVVVGCYKCAHLIRPFVPNSPTRDHHPSCACVPVNASARAFSVIRRSRNGRHNNNKYYKKRLGIRRVIVSWRSECNKRSKCGFFRIKLCRPPCPGLAARRQCVDAVGDRRLPSSSKRIILGARL